MRGTVPLLSLVVQREQLEPHAWPTSQVVGLRSDLVALVLERVRPSPLSAGWDKVVLHTYQHYPPTAATSQPESADVAVEAARLPW
jgi:hypothetical protein